jgi:hypothetical protein
MPMSGGTGFVLPKRWPTRAEVEHHSFKMSAARAADTGSLFKPTTLGVPTIKDQANSSACFGFAAVQGAHLWRQARSLASSLPSPMVPYWAARREALATDDAVLDDGSDPDSMVAALRDFGASSWESDPFDVTRINARPGGVTLTDAQKLPCGLHPILETGFALWTAAQHAIQFDRQPVLVAVEVTPSFDRALGGVVDEAPGDGYRGLHAICGFASEAGGLRIANSWGLGYGSEGTAILTPAFLGARCVWAGRLEVL